MGAVAETQGILASHQVYVLKQIVLKQRLNPRGPFVVIDLRLAFQVLIKAIVNRLASDSPAVRAVFVLFKPSALLRRDVYARNGRNGMSQPFALVGVQMALAVKGQFRNWI